MNLHVHRSNRLESLAGALAGLMRTPLESVLKAEIVIVQSQGMRRWLSLELAQRLGVTMNVEFPFPAKFAADFFRAVFPEERVEDRFRRDLLPWRVLGLFPEMLDRPEWSELRSYVEGEMRSLKEYQLAQRIAAMFDRYLAYRPELLLQWQSRCGEEGWQPQLWRALIEDDRQTHPAALLQRVERLGASAGGVRGLPERIAVFGLSSLPPLYLHLLRNVARLLEVHLFVLEPTDQYWGDIETRRERDRRVREHPGTLAEPGEENALLASFCRAGRDFTRLVQDLEPVRESEAFAPPERGNLLSHLQAEIFGDEPREAGERQPLAALDESLQIHCCHGPMRELEVLHDQLLHFFEKIPGLTPRDILVAMPDVETYAPFVEAVFGSAENPDHSIPFTIADRSGRSESRVADAFLRILDLHGSRFTAPDVLALLDSTAIRERFGLLESDLDPIRAWVAQTRICWGIDEAHRATFKVPATRDNTWRAGLDRLLLGYAMPGDETTLFEGLHPIREVEGSFALVCGRFVEFAETLFSRVPPLGQPRTLPEWERCLRELLRAFFDDSDESADEVRRLRDIVGALGEIATESGCDRTLDFEVIRAHLTAALAGSESGAGFLAGHVTFCGLKPMRAIPFKVVCLIGMNDAAFPRRDPELAFDRMLSEPRHRGDRSQRDDDRYLFLEAILSARDALYLSYCGLSPKDNSPSPPSVVVSELIDYIAAQFSVAGIADDKLADALVVRHHLHAFSAAYFSADLRLFSYSEENARASATTIAERVAAPAFGSGRLTAPEPAWMEIDADDLATFFTNAVRFFARERLKIALPSDTLEIGTCEPLTLDALDRYGLRQQTVRAALQEIDPALQRQVARATGALPHGWAGDSIFASTLVEAAAFAAQIREQTGGPELPPLPVDLAMGEWRITGTLRGIHRDAMIAHRPARTAKAKDLLAMWVRHLILQNLCAPVERSILLTMEEAIEFAAVPDAAGVLLHLLSLYQRGLCEPLPLFPESSYEFALRTLDPGRQQRKSPRAAAFEVWNGQEFSEARGEKDDEWFALCFGDRENPLDEDWSSMALEIFTPLLAARRNLA